MLTYQRSIPAVDAPALIQMRGSLFLSADAADAYPFLPKGSEVWILEGDQFHAYTLDEPFDVLVWKSPDSFLDVLIDSVKKKIK